MKRIFIYLVIGCAVLCAVLVPVMVVVGLQELRVQAHQNLITRQLAERTADTVEDITQPPLSSPKLLSLSVNGGPPITDFDQVIYAHPCDDRWEIIRQLTANKAGQVKIAKSWDGGHKGILPAPEGSETFSAGVNTMKPLVQVPSNAERHQYLRYDISVSMAGSIAASTIMQPIKVYILDPGEKAPPKGVYLPPRDDPTPDDHKCDVIVNPSTASSAGH